MKSLFLLLTIVLLLSLPAIQSGKKKKNTQKKPENPKERRPDKVKPELYCDACQAMVKEAIKALFGKKKESDVIDVLTDVCNPEKYYVYCIYF
jgi:hypothetical protein